MVSFVFNNRKTIFPSFGSLFYRFISFVDILKNEQIFIHLKLAERGNQIFLVLTSLF